MTDGGEFDKRDVLKASGLTLLSSLAGCASVVQQAGSNGDGDGGSGGSGSRETPTRTESTRTTARTTESAPTDGGGGQRTTETARGGTNASGTSEATTAERVAISAPDLGVSGASLPADPNAARYPTMGTASETVTVYGSWKCPYTREFVRGQLGSLVEEFVAAGDLSLRFRGVAYQDDEPYLGADAPRAAQAGQAVWDVDPESFWSYFAYVFENQPREGREWATTDRLLRFGRRAGVRGRDQVRRAIESRAYARPISRTTEAAARNGVETLPRVVGDGRVTAPTRNPHRTRAQLDRIATDG
jgi:protein-disulfide isomerase